MPPENDVPLLGQSNVEIPVELYGGDDGDIGWVPHATRAEAIALAISWWGKGDFGLRARRCYLRLATREEATQNGWDPDQTAVIVCERDEPGAVTGWEVS